MFGQKKMTGKIKKRIATLKMNKKILTNYNLLVTALLDSRINEIKHNKITTARQTPTFVQLTVLSISYTRTRDYTF